MVVELLTFRLASGVDEAAFLEADARVQAQLSSREGFMRRTTARAADDGEWLVVSLWSSVEAAETGSPGHGLDGLDGLVDDATAVRKRYLTLD